MESSTTCTAPRCNCKAIGADAAAVDVPVEGVHQPIEEPATQEKGGPRRKRNTWRRPGRPAREGWDPACAWAGLERGNYARGVSAPGVPAPPLGLALGIGLASALRLALALATGVCPSTPRVAALAVRRLFATSFTAPLLVFVSKKRLDGFLVHRTIGQKDLVLQLVLAAFGARVPLFATPRIRDPARDDLCQTERGAAAKAQLPE